MKKNVNIFSILLLFSSSVWALEDFNCQKIYPQAMERLSQEKDHSNLKIKTKWFPVSHPRGSILLLHGLNVNGEALNELIELYQSLNLNVLRGILTGHKGDYKNFSQVSVEDWERDFRDLVCLVDRHSQEKNLPFWVSGFSLGGAVITHQLNHLQEMSHFRGSVLFAPAVKVYWYTRLLKVLKFLSFNFFEFHIPSFNLKEIRVYSQTPLQAYLSLLSLIEKIHQKRPKDFQSPVLIFAHPQDRLIPFSQIHLFIKKNHLSQWKLQKIDTSLASQQGQMNHFWLQKNFLGDSEWAKLLQITENFIHSTSQLTD